MFSLDIFAARGGPARSSPLHSPHRLSPLLAPHTDSPRPRQNVECPVSSTVRGRLGRRMSLISRPPGPLESAPYLAT